MKTLISRFLPLFGIALLAAAMVFSFASCDNGSDSGSGSDPSDPVKVLGSGTHGDFQYDYTASTIIITGYTGGGGHVTIPKTIKGKPVTAIRDGAYFKNGSYFTDGVFYNKQLTSVTIPDSIISIGDWTFFGTFSENSVYRNRLTSVDIPNSVISIGEGAFAANKLTSITIGNGVTSIGQYAFGYNELTSVIIPDSIIYLNGFNANPLLTSVTIGNGVTSIGEEAFYQSNLTSVVIPDSVTSIGNGAFFHNQLSSVIIGNGVTSIGRSAFRSNPLTSITIGADVMFDDEGPSFDDSFDYAYNRYNKTAGTYILGTSWEKIN